MTYNVEGYVMSFFETWISLFVVMRRRVPLESVARE